VKGIESHGEIVSTGLMAEGFGQMSFTFSGESDKEYTFASFDEATGCQLPDVGSIDGRVEREIKRFQPFFGSHAGLRERAF